MRPIWNWEGKWEERARSESSCESGTVVGCSLADPSPVMFVQHFPVERDVHCSESSVVEVVDKLRG